MSLMPQLLPEAPLPQQSHQPQSLHGSLQPQQSPQLPASRPVRDRKQTPKAAALVENQKEIVAATAHATTVMKTSEKRKTPVSRQNSTQKRTSYPNVNGESRPPTTLLYEDNASLLHKKEESPDIIEIDPPSPPAQKVHSAKSASLAPHHTPYQHFITHQPIQKPTTPRYSIKSPSVNHNNNVIVDTPTKHKPPSQRLLQIPTPKPSAPLISGATVKPPASTQKNVVVLPPRVQALLRSLKTPTTPIVQANSQARGAEGNPQQHNDEEQAQSVNSAPATPLDKQSNPAGKTPTSAHLKRDRAKKAPLSTPAPAVEEASAVASPMDQLLALVEQAIPIPAAPIPSLAVANSDEENVSLLMEEAPPVKRTYKRRRAPATPVPSVIQLDTPPSAEKRKRKSPTTHINPVCMNCGTRETSQWRRAGEGDEVECNPCSLYFKKRGHARPVELNREIVRRYRKSEGADEENKPQKRIRKKTEKMVALDLERALEAIVPRENIEDFCS